MPINLASFIQPRNATNPDPALRNTYYLLEDIYVKGGYQVRTNIAERDAINPLNVKEGMLVYTQADKKLWILGNDLHTWSEFKTGGSAPARTSITHTTDSLSPNGFVDFTLPLGSTVLIESLSVDKPITVEAFDSPARNNSNPYKFIATASHLADDGSTLMSDGSVVKGRRYSILANGESPLTNLIYFRITNSSPVATAVILNISYLPLE
jgi:hypothetical protein